MIVDLPDGPRLYDPVQVGRGRAARRGLVVTWRLTEHGRLLRIKLEGAEGLNVPGGEYRELLASDPRLSSLPLSEILDTRARVA